MIGIVVVSHSATLANGVRELASQLASPARLEVAAGVDDPEHPIGTDALAVMNAIEAADDGDGVLVLMDLGSALLSAETALELLPSELSARVRLCSAPLVEGTLAAVVAAGNGLGMEDVMAEAVRSLEPKQAMLAPRQPMVEPVVVAPEPAAPADAEPWLECAVTIDNQHGLHVRPAAKLAAALRPFTAEVWLRRGEKEVNPRSLSRLAMLDVRKGDQLTLRARGQDAAEVVSCFRQLAAERFGEPA